MASQSCHYFIPDAAALGAPKSPNRLFLDPGLWALLVVFGQRMAREWLQFSNSMSSICVEIYVFSRVTHRTDPTAEQPDVDET